MPFPLDGFLLMLSRLSGLFLVAPIFSSRQIPGTVKALILVLLSATLSYFTQIDTPVKIDSPGMFLAAMAVEVAVGYTIGFVASMVFAAIQLAGQVMDMQMGFGIVNVVDPLSGTQIPLMGNLTQTLALLLYLAIDGHHYLLEAIIHSYKVIPVLGFSLSPSFYDLLAILAVQLFAIAVKISAPMVVSLLTTDIAMGFIARTVPQMNVFIVGMPLKIFLGFAVLLLLLPVYIWVFGILFSRFFTYLDQVMLAVGI